MQAFGSPLLCCRGRRRLQTALVNEGHTGTLRDLQIPERHRACRSATWQGLSMKDYLDGKESQYKELLQATGALAALSGQRPGPITVSSVVVPLRVL
eukprot:scaffold75369_cov22-Tisochrysis_lutea.AAC.7